MNYKRAIILFLSAITVFRLIYINLFPLLGDEAYYWQWSRHLDFAYYEQGPVTALVIFIFTAFSKINTLFTIRLGAVILSLLTMVLSVLIYKKIYVRDSNLKQNFFNLLFINSAIIYSAGAILMMHDTVMVFFFALFIYTMLGVINNPGNNRLWAYAGITLAAGVMSKYTLITVYLAVLIFLLTSPGGKKNIKGFFVFTFFFAVFLLPVIYWNSTHDFATLKYLAVRKGSGSSFTLKYTGELIGGQIGLTSVFLFPFFVLAFIKNIKKRAFNAQYLLSVFFAVSFAPFLILSFKSRVEANWPAFSFFPLFFITTNYIFSLKNLKKYIFHSIYALGFLITALIYIQIVKPVFPLPGRMNPLKKAYGYKELAGKIDSIYNSYREKGPVFLASRHYQAASLFSFYMQGNPDFFIIIKHESSKNYRFWNRYRKLTGYNCIFVWSEPWEHDVMDNFFESSETVAEAESWKNGKMIRKFNIDFNKNFKGK